MSEKSAVSSPVFLWSLRCAEPGGAAVNGGAGAEPAPPRCSRLSPCPASTGSEAGAPSRVLGHLPSRCSPWVGFEEPVWPCQCCACSPEARRCKAAPAGSLLQLEQL